MLDNDSGILSSKELDERLERWANWAREPYIGAISSEVGYMKERLDPFADSAEMTPEIALTERACARTKLEDKAYYSVIARYYLGQQPICFIAQFFDKPEKSIQRLFDEAKGRIGWYIFEIESEDLTASPASVK